MRRIIMMVSLMAVVGGFAETFTWTGAVDGKWTNAANWTVGGVAATRCPGIVSNDIWDVNGEYVDNWSNTIHRVDLVEFATVAAGKATTIDLEGHYCVSSIVFRAGCDRFTLGADSNQVVAIQAFGNGWASAGRFTIEYGAHAPELVAGFSCGAANKAITRNHATTTYACVENYSDEELVFGTFGHSRQFATYSEVGHIKTDFSGTGDFRFAGPVRGVGKYSEQYKLYQNMNFNFSGTGHIVFATPQFGRGKTGSKRDAEENHGLYAVNFSGNCPGIEILEGCRVSISEWNYPLLTCQCNAEIKGAGTFQYCVMGDKGINGNFGNVWVSSGRTLKISCIFDVYDSGNKYLALRFSNGGNASGALYICGPDNLFSGDVWFYDTPTDYKASSVANFGGGTEVYFKVNGAFDYAGAGDETLTRNFRIIANDAAATLRNTGSGTLAFDGLVSLTNSTLTGVSGVFSPETAPIVFAGAVEAPVGKEFPLVKKGASTLRIAAAADLAGVSAIRLVDGSLDVSERFVDGALTLAIPLTYDGGSSSVCVPDGCTLTLSSLSATAGQSAGSLNFVIFGSGAVKVDGATADTPLPAGVTVNGFPAKFDASGAVVTDLAGLQIAARGDTVPNAPDKTVYITSDGAGGADTLASSSISVAELVNGAPGAAAVIALGADETLALGAARMTSGASALTLGDEAGRGAIVGMDGPIEFENLSTDNPLTVCAKLADAFLVDTPASGEVVFAGGNAAAQPLSVIANGRVKLSGGTFTTGEATVWVGATNRVDATKIARLTVTNAVIATDAPGAIYDKEDTVHSLAVGVAGDGILTVEAGTVITNRIQVGGKYGDSIVGHGAMIQNGGEVTMLGNAGEDGSGSAIGISTGGASYELHGGLFTMLGALNVGYYQSRATFLQTGGVAVFTNAYGSATKSTVGPLSNANGGQAAMCFAGGRAKVYANIVLTGGATNNGKSFMTVENEADVDAGDNTVKLCGTHSNCYFTNSADVVIASGGTLRAAGFYCGRNPSNPAFPQIYSVGFNGGVFKTGANDRDIFRASTSDYAQAVTNVLVFAGGMTIDTDGRTGNSTASSIRGASGSGVIGLPGMATTSGFVNMPIAMIQGDGVGAVATVDFDLATRTFKGVKILTPGSGYTWAQIAVYKDSGYSYLSDPNNQWTRYVPVSLGTIANTGSFTKKGEGDFTLNAANSWGGDTRLEGGVLRLGAAGALPAGSKVVYAGGMLESTAAASPAVLNAEIADGSIKKSFDLITYTDEAPTTAPVVNVTGLQDPSHWLFELRGKKLRAVYARGSMFIFR